MRVIRLSRNAVSAVLLRANPDVSPERQPDYQVLSMQCAPCAVPAARGSAHLKRRNIPRARPAANLPTRGYCSKVEPGTRSRSINGPSPYAPTPWSPIPPCPSWCASRNSIPRPTRERRPQKSASPYASRMTRSYARSVSSIFRWATSSSSLSACTPTWMAWRFTTLGRSDDGKPCTATVPRRGSEGITRDHAAIEHAS